MINLDKPRDYSFAQKEVMLAALMVPKPFGQWFKAIPHIRRLKIDIFKEMTTPIMFLKPIIRL